MEIDRWIEALEDLHEWLGPCFVRPEVGSGGYSLFDAVLGRVCQAGVNSGA